MQSLNPEYLECRERAGIVRGEQPTHLFGREAVDDLLLHERLLDRDVDLACLQRVDARVEARALARSHRCVEHSLTVGGELVHRRLEEESGADARRVPRCAQPCGPEKVAELRMLIRRDSPFRLLAYQILELQRVFRREAAADKLPIDLPLITGRQAALKLLAQQIPHPLALVERQPVGREQMIELGLLLG